MNIIFSRGDNSNDNTRLFRTHLTAENYQNFRNVWNIGRLSVILCTAIIYLYTIVMPASQSYALSPSPLTEHITGFSGSDYSAVEQAVQKLEHTKNIVLWAYLTDDNTNPKMVKDALTRNFTDKDILIYISKAGHPHCNEQTCPITITGSSWLHNLSPTAKSHIRSQLRSLVDHGQYADAVTHFAHELTISPYHAYAEHATGSSGGLAMTILFLIIVSIICVIVYLNSKKNNNVLSKKLTLSKTYQADELSQHSVHQLNKYSHKVLYDADEGVRNYHYALEEAKEQLGATTVTKFSTAYNNAANALAKAHHIRQLLDDDIKETSEEQKTMLIELITTIQTAQKNLSETASTFNQLRKDFLEAPDFLEKLRDKSIELSRKIDESEKTLNKLKESYAPSVIASINDNAQGAHDLYSIAQINLEKGRSQLQQGSPELVQSVHIASNAIRKAEELLTSIDHAQSNIDSAILELPTEINQSKQVLTNAQQYVQELSTKNIPIKPELSTQINQLIQVLNFSQENQRTDPLGCLSRLKDITTKVDKLYYELAEQDRQKSHAQENLRSNIFTANAYISGASDFISTHSAIIDSTPRTRLAQAQGLLDAAQTALSPTVPLENITKAEDQALQANRYAREALSLAEKQVTFWQRSQYRPSGGGFMHNAAGSFFGTLLAESLFRDTNRYGSGWDYSNSWGSSDWGGSSDWDNF